MTYNLKPAESINFGDFIEYDNKIYTVVHKSGSNQLTIRKGVIEQPKPLQTKRSGNGLFIQTETGDLLHPSVSVKVLDRNEVLDFKSML